MASRRGARPSGTDGSDHQYRMVIESKYHKVADVKKRLKTLLALQSLYYGCFIAWNCGVPLLEGKRPAPIVGVMPLVGFMAIILGRKGVGSGSAKSTGAALIGYIVCSVIGFFFAIANAYVMQTMVHYMDSYANRFGVALEIASGLPKDLLFAFGQMIEGGLHASGMLVQGLGAYLAVSLRTASSSTKKA